MSSRAATVIVSIAVLTIFATLGTDSIWLDEADAIQLATTHSLDQLWSDRVDPRHPPLFFVVLHWITSVLGTGEAVVRLPSAIAFAANVALVAALTYRLGLGADAAALAAILIALSPLHVWYGQEARMYASVISVMLLFAIGLVFNSWPGALVATAGLTLGLWLDFTTVPMSAGLMAIWIVWWWHHGRKPWDLLRTGLVVAMSLYLAAPAWRHLAQLLPELDQVTVFAKLKALVGVESIPPDAFLVALALATLIVMACAELLLRLTQFPRFVIAAERSVPVLFLALMVASAVPRAYSVKQVLVVGWPVVVIPVAWLLSLPTFNRAFRTVIVIVSGIAAAATIITPRADWRGAVEYIDGHHREGDVVWLDPGWNVIPYNYYQPQVRPLAGQDLETTANSVIAQDKTVWLVAERFGGSSQTAASEAWLASHMKIIEAVTLPRLEVRRYARLADPP